MTLDDLKPGLRYSDLEGRRGTDGPGAGEAIQPGDRELPVSAGAG